MSCLISLCIYVFFFLALLCFFRFKCSSKFTEFWILIGYLSVLFVCCQIFHMANVCLSFWNFQVHIVAIDIPYTQWTSVAPMLATQWIQIQLFVLVWSTHDNNLFDLIKVNSINQCFSFFTFIVYSSYVKRIYEQHWHFAVCFITNRWNCKAQISCFRFVSQLKEN